MQVEERTGPPEAAGKRPEAMGERLEAALEALREECSVPPAAPGFLARFRARRAAWIDGGTQTAAWRLLALRLAPAGALAALAAIAFAVGFESPQAEAPAPPVAEYDDPFAAGLEEVGVATVAVADDDGYEFLAVLYEPLGTR